MRLSILGIGGTYMAGFARLALAAGHQVTGFDGPLYPPMSDQLEALQISCHDLHDVDALWNSSPDCVIVGNICSRGHPMIEAVLNAGLPYASAPQWLNAHILNTKKVLAVTGTHGKTSTSAMLAHILECTGHHPSFLIGGVPENFKVSARLTDSPYFVVEADEYDTAFFDKRPKFLQVNPHVLTIGAVEYDHADIYPSLESIEQQFKYLLRNVPGDKTIIGNVSSASTCRILENQHSQLATLGTSNADWQLKQVSNQWHIVHSNAPGIALGDNLIGAHNRLNALTATAAAHAIGISVQDSCAALKQFKPVKRRLQHMGTVRGIDFYDDFAHHPSAIEATMTALKEHFPSRPVIAVVDLGTRSMQNQAYSQSQWQAALEGLHHISFYASRPLKWSLEALQSSLSGTSSIVQTPEELLSDLPSRIPDNAIVCLMSNTGFNQVLPKLVSAMSLASIES